MNKEKLYDRIAGWYDLRHHSQTLWADDFHREQVIHHAGIKNNERVLELGVGTGITIIRAYQDNPNARYIGIDISLGMLEQAVRKLEKLDLDNRIELIRGDIENLPFGNNSIDKIISTYGLGWMQNPQRVIKEVRRVAKPNARITLAEMSEPPKEYRFRNWVHNKFVEPWIYYFWNFRDLDLKKIFEEGGFTIEHYKWFNNWFLGSTSLISGRVVK